AMLERAFLEESYPLTEKGLKGVLKNFQKEDVDDLEAEVGNGHISARDVLEAVYPGTKKKAASKSANVVPLSQARSLQAKADSGAIPIKGLIPGMAVHYAGCCHPLPGDRIVGIITTGKGVTVHTIDCDTLEQFTDEPERWIDVSWESSASSTELHVSRVHLIVLNVPGSLGDLSNVIARNNGNISNLKIISRQADFFDMTVDIEVKDVKHLSEIIAALRATPAINSVERARG
ncbi:MAG: bifunctional (p)ppGpp synthetase/guanosine-3',5'-bis(diphosphate) 3'-pyrophosphohydrolase, partial [Rhodospirillaceae bacterium]|nr:bifunctional (p)ppGpp synthetase/guanosine-3',5'-bis(diphosphate) 3'-pyrophosphohydrolase [Rhodospirillaceae bacterium]